MAQSPLAQFEIHDVAPLSAGGFDVSFTNSAMWMVAVLGIIWIFMVGGTRKAALVPGRWQAAVEVVTGFVAGDDPTDLTTQPTCSTTYTVG